MIERLEDVVVLGSEFSTLRLEVDPRDGTPRRLVDGDRSVELACTARVLIGGREERGPTGGLVYVDTVTVPLRPGDGSGADREEAHLVKTHVGPVTERVAVTSRSFAVPLPPRAGLAATWHYTLSADAPRLSARLEIRTEAAGTVVRNIVITIVPLVGDLDGWRLNAPGNRLRTDLELAALSHPTSVLPVGGVDGSIGLITLDRDDPVTTILVWPLSHTEIGDIRLAPAGSGPEIEWQTDVAGEPGPGGSLVARSLLLDVLDRPFADVVPDVPGMLAAQGITSPGSAPDWAAQANLYEVQIGFSVFKGGHRYEPYPTAQHLLDDLDRIAGLGYTALQIMPRQPYPSYNVHDLDDVTTSWGEEDVLRQIVQECHARGMHVILDILMHGVIDGEALDATLEAIRSGPYVDRMEDVMPDITVLERDELDYIWITWSRHILDFEPYWRAGSPRRHPMVDEHPEWFCRDSSGGITGMYTQAFDVAHPGWQRWFIDSSLALMDRLGIDGFRFDAPSYNYVHNWSERTRTDAAVSMLGSLSLFERIRGEMRRKNPDAVLYTEPSGALFRQAMDVNYNYDEQWLVRAVMTGGGGNKHWVRNARELAAWLAQRDATLPVGSLTAHHLDSHDTFWWPDWGTRWRREQYGAPAAAALMAVFALSGGPYMTFVGGEVGIEDAVRRVNRLRLDSPCFGRGSAEYGSVCAGDDDVYAVVRRFGDSAGLVLVNLSDRVVTTPVVLTKRGRSETASGNAGDRSTGDLLGSAAATWRADGGRWTAEVTLEPYAAAAYDLADLVAGPRP